ncbi:MAG TPA: hypothetical protein VND70_04920 [Acidimicrobiales bacterium]|nr:hypothetical protein [Acidimicrobiales bacterium]
MSLLGHALELILALGLVAFLAAAVAYLVARRFVRRRWTRLRSHVATRGALSAFSLILAGHERAVARLTPEEASCGSSARVRRRMWVAIEGAEEAVRHAEVCDAPVAELPAVCRSLRTLAAEMDHLLRLERRLPPGPDRPTAVRVQVAELIRASRLIQGAALGACSDTAEPQVRSLVRQAGDEVEIVTAVLTRLRSVAPHPR